MKRYPCIFIAMVILAVSAFVPALSAGELTAEDRAIRWRHIADCYFAQQLEKSNRELEGFAHIASHDLQEPLRKIQAFGDRLKSKCGHTMNREAMDYLDRMQAAARRMQTLVIDLLKLSRVNCLCSWVRADGKACCAFFPNPRPRCDSF